MNSDNRFSKGEPRTDNFFRMNRSYDSNHYNNHYNNHNNQNNHNNIQNNNQNNNHVTSTDATNSISQVTDNAQLQINNSLVLNNNTISLHNSQNTFQPKKPKYSAGILPYQVGDNGKIYLLVGKDNHGTWSDFGGKCEIQDKNNIKETASREFFEESLNAIVDLSTTRELLKNENNYTLIKSKTISGYPYYMFILRLPMLPDTSRDRFKKTLQYLKYIEADYKSQEKTDIKWVSMDTIMHILEYPEYEKELGWPLREVFKNTMVNNKGLIQDIKNKINFEDNSM
jgi:hypothetical protein